MTAVLFICTGNAARSVMAGVALRELRPDVEVETAGTLAVDGMPISWRTRAALDAVGLPWPRHASKQATRTHLTAADLVVAMAPEHVHWVRREHHDVRHKTATLKRLVRSLPPPDSQPGAAVHGRLALPGRVALLGLDGRPIEASEEIVDPGGGEVDDFVACAREVVALVEQLAARL